MSFRLHQPSGPLRPLVQSIWSATLKAADAPVPGLIAPDAHVEFVFHLGAPCAMQRTGFAAWQCQPRAMLYAQRRACVRLRSTGVGSMVAFRTSPVVATQIIGRSLDELWDQPIALRDLMGSRVDLLIDRLVAATASQRFAIVEQWLSGLLSAWSADHAFCERLHTALAWRSRGQSLALFAAASGMSMRSLRRRVDQSTGLAPKQIELSGRLLRSCALLRERPELSLTAIALQLGFSDHAAFTNAFRDHHGLTPSAFRDEPLVFYERGPG